MENVILKLFKLLCFSSLNLPNHAFLSTFSHRITGIATPYKYTYKAIIRMSMLTFLTKIIGCIHRFSRKRTYICTSLVSENRMTRIISPQTGFHQEYFIKHIVMFEK